MPLIYNSLGHGASCLYNLLVAHLLGFRRPLSRSTAFPTAYLDDTYGKVEESMLPVKQ